MDIIDIPEANTIRINVGSGVIIHDNSNNLICTEIEPTRLINQTATLETECIIAETLPSNNSRLYITIPNYNSGIFNSPNDYKIKILFLLMFLSYTSVLFFIIFLLNHRQPMKH